MLRMSVPLDGARLALLVRSIGHIWSTSAHDTVHPSATVTAPADATLADACRTGAERRAEDPDSAGAEQLAEKVVGEIASRPCSRGHTRNRGKPMDQGWKVEGHHPTTRKALDLDAGSG